MKASHDIFGTHWSHLRDGAGEEGSNDRTVTTSERFEPGQVVVARGPVTIDKDLGYGYFYSVILENAMVTAE